MVCVIACGSPENFSISPKVYTRKFIPTYQNMCTGITPATEIKSIGLPASLPPAGIPAAVSVFAS